MNYPIELERYSEKELQAAWHAKVEKRLYEEDKEKNRVFNTGCKPIGWRIGWGGNERYAECELVVEFDKNVPRREQDYYDKNYVVAASSQFERDLIEFVARHRDFFKDIPRLR